MLKVVVQRLLVMPFLLLGIVTATFLLAQFTKGNPLVSIIGARNLDNPEIVAAAKARWGLDGSVPERYAVYVWNLVHGDLGTSFRTKQPVLTDLLQRLPATLELVICAMIVGTIGGIVLAIISAEFRNTFADHLARLIALTGSCLPVFWLGLIALFLFSVQMKLLPGPGRLDIRAVAPPTVTGFMLIDTLLARDGSAFLDALRHLVLPSLVLGWSVVGIIARMVRASMLDVLGQDYITMARAKGAGRLRVLIHHALANALIPALTILGFTFAYLITGSVLVETIFSWPGIGSYAVDAARSLDYPAITGVTIIGGLGFLIANLLTDIAYAAADPRMREAG
ncbi:Dipeptide transport system permease protein DppB [Starkeya nomas]|uniref:Dipeptide transport system permease protein DppB n=1 Tax=Starkeya nomas TaxID=2666134 RepID=A0A5S9ND93_9HYPH|nr:ABC transporter permease [Starkeya nomas]CAA0087479.1 Dipeptide transport system permease protein DppB [Starkeya nomas]